MEHVPDLMRISNQCLKFSSNCSAKGFLKTLHSYSQDGLIKKEIKMPGKNAMTQKIKKKNFLTRNLEKKGFMMAMM
jgi:hypothetical protein